MQISLSRAYELLRRSFAKFAYGTKSCAIIARIYETSGLRNRAKITRANFHKPVGWADEGSPTFPAIAGLRKLSPTY
jgi:hypothetical protein